MHTYDSLDLLQDAGFVYLQKSKKSVVVGIICSIHWVNYNVWFGHASMISMCVTDNVQLHKVNLI
jgi:hypothetical protein